MNYWKSLAHAAVLSVASAAVALPQSFVQNATFNLPYEAHWNSTVLEPGIYELSIPSAGNWPQVVRLSKDGKAISLLPVTQSSTVANGPSQLRLEKVGQTAVVTDLDLGEASKSFHFAVPRTLRSELAVANGRPSTKTVALISAGK